MDKNTVIGFVLIAAVLIGFTYLQKPSEEESQRQREQQERQNIEYAQTQEEVTKSEEAVVSEGNVVDDFFAVPTQKDTLSTVNVANANAKEEILSLENDKVKINFSTKGGQMVSTNLKEYTNYKEEPLHIYKENDASMNMVLVNKAGRRLNTSDLIFTSVPVKSNNSLVMRFAYGAEQYVDFIYTLSEDDYTLKFDINLVGMREVLNRDRIDMFELSFTEKMAQLENSRKNEQRYSGVHYKLVGDDVKGLSTDKNEGVEVKVATKWIAFKNQFFANILIADDKIETVLLDSKVFENGDYLKSCEARLFVPAKLGKTDNILHAGFRYYIGPMSVSKLEAYDENVKSKEDQLDLDQLIPLGWALFRWVNKYFVIPLFNLLKSSGLSMGLVILLLTFIVKLLISPLTYKSFMSSAKMRVLKPQVEELNAKYPKPEQAQEKQQAVMALYSRAGANPMSGCVPILLQMPIIIALFQFFPNLIDLRHESFLWAKDLSTYDSIWSLPDFIPFIGGTHLSLFCILMTVTNIIYTKFNMDATNTGQQQMPGMKWMMYLMPLIFFFVLNDYPSGLTYYYFISLLITILLTLSFRFMVDEKKVLAKLEANKAKPKKKSGFMARLEEAQRLQQQQQANGKKGKKK